MFWNTRASRKFQSRYMNRISRMDGEWVGENSPFSRACLRVKTTRDFPSSLLLTTVIKRGLQHQWHSVQKMPALRGVDCGLASRTLHGSRQVTGPTNSVATLPSFLAEQVTALTQITVPIPETSTAPTKFADSPGKNINCHSVPTVFGLLFVRPRSSPSRPLAPRPSHLAPRFFSPLSLLQPFPEVLVFSCSRVVFFSSLVSLVRLCTFSLLRCTLDDERTK